MNKTRELAQFVTEITYNDMKKEVIEKAKGLVLDQFGLQLAFANLPWCKAVYKYVEGRKGGREDSTIVNYGLRTTVEDATFANATFGYGNEMDDYDLSCLAHPGNVIVPAAFAIGEREMINGKEFLTAVVVGYDVMQRIARAARSMHDRWFFPTTATGTFGTAAVTSKSLRFNTDMTLNALSIAAFQSCGIEEFGASGGVVVHVQNAFSAHAGVRSAFLAQGGITGPPTPLEGKRGFCQAFANDYSLNEITDGLGKDFRILAVGNKRYCCTAALHSTIDAVVKIMEKHTFKLEEIEEVVVALKRREYNATETIHQPSDVAGSQFSARFAVALRLIKGGNGFKDYTEENARDPEVLSMTKKVTPVFDEELEKLPLNVVAARVTIKLKNGTSYQERVDYARGTPGNPMTEAELQDKFRELASPVIPDEQVERIIQNVAELEKLDNVSKLAPLLVGMGCRQV
jgi:2-methylcitrate dehydratase PrpD